MLSTTLKINLTGSMTELGKQTNFAAASALTLTAKEVQKRVQKEIHGSFQVRTDWDVRGPLAIKVKPATKQDLVAWVGTGFEALEKFVEKENGVIVDLPQGRYFAIPTSNVRRTKRDLIRKAQLPRALIGRDFIIKTRKRNILVLFQRRGRKGSRSKNRSAHGDPNLFAMYILYPQRKIKEQDFLFGPSRQVFEGRFASILAQQFEKAFATAR
jgi:hypothetical protein